MCKVNESCDRIGTMVCIFLLRFKDRFNIWKQVVWSVWRRLVLFLTTAFSIVGIAQSQSGGWQIFRWDWWVWALIGLIVLWIITLEGAYRLLRIYRPLNWIDKHMLIHGKLPVLPKYLRGLVNGYSDGEPISQNIEPITPSGQTWNGLLSSQKNEWKELVRWLGKEPQDLIDHMNMMLPKTPDIILRRKGWERK